MEKVKVIFRKCANSGELIAFFPETPVCPGNIMSYMHKGQHAEASYEFYTSTKNCGENEYDSLLQELKQIYEPDYKLIIKKKLHYHDLLESWRYVIENGGKNVL